MKKVWRGGAWGTSFSTGEGAFDSNPRAGGGPVGGCPQDQSRREVFSTSCRNDCRCADDRGKFRSSAPRAGRRTIAPRRFYSTVHAALATPGNLRSSDGCSTFALQLSYSGTPSNAL